MCPLIDDDPRRQHSRITVVADVLLPDEIGVLDSAKEFLRLVAEFDVPRNAKALRRRKVGSKATTRKGRKRR
jgi:hypothetical protein